MPDYDLLSGLAKEVTLQNIEDILNSGSVGVKGEDGSTIASTSNRLPTVSILANENGVEYSPSNPLPVSVSDLTIESLTVTFPDSVVSTLNSTSTPLAENATFTGGWEDVLTYAAISAIILTDQASATNGAIVDFSDDGVTAIRSATATIPANTGLSFMFAPEARYFRIRYTNGPVAQTSVRTQVLLHYQTPITAQLPMAAQTTDLNLAGLTQAHLKGRYSNGAWLPVSVTAAGIVNVTGAVTVSSSALPTGAATEATLALRNSAFATLINLQPYATTNRLKVDPGTVLSDPEYHGRNVVRSAADSDATWEVVKFLKNAGGEVIDMQYKSGIAWNDRTNATHWEV